MSARKTLVAVAVLGVIAALVFWWRSVNDVPAPHIDVVTVPDVPAPRAEPVVPKPEPLVQKPVAPAALPATAPVAPTPTAASERFKFNAEQLDAVVAEMWEGMLPGMKLSPDQSAALVALLQKRQVAILDAVNAALERGLEDPRDIAAIRGVADAVRAQFDDKLRQEFGDAVFAQYRAWDNTRTERNTLTDYQRAAAAAGEPSLLLTPEQAAQFIATLGATKTAYMPPGIGRVIYGGMNQRARISDQTVEALRTTGDFSPEQIQHLQQVQQRQQGSPPPAGAPPKR